MYKFVETMPKQNISPSTRFFLHSVTKSSTARFSHENVVEKNKIFVRYFVPIRTALTVLVSGSLWPNFCAGFTSVCLHGTVRLASCIRVVVQLPHDRRTQIYSKPRNLSVCALYSIGESVQRIRRLLYVLDNAANHNKSQRTTVVAGRFIALCTYLQPWRGTARGL